MNAEAPHENQVEINRMIVSSSPHMYADTSIKKIMWTVNLTLMPAVVFAVYHFGLPALQTMLAGSLSAVAFEAMCQKVLKKPVTVDDEIGRAHV